MPKATLEVRASMKYMKHIINIQPKVARPNPTLEHRRKRAKKPITMSQHIRNGDQKKLYTRRFSGA